MGKSRARSASRPVAKSKKKKKRRGITIVLALKLFSGFARKRAADPDRDKAVSNALAQQATSIPKIDAKDIPKAAAPLPVGWLVGGGHAGGCMGKCRGNSD